MARGKVIDKELQAQIFALLAQGKSVSDVAREVGLPRSTVQSWEERFVKKSEEIAKREAKPVEETAAKPDDEVTNEPVLDLVKARELSKKEFVEKAWSLINKSQTLIERRLDRAIESEDEIDQILYEVMNLDHKELTDNERKALAKRIMALKVENIKDLAVVLGTIYDKQALANKEPTTIIDGKVKKFEEWE
ncbi:MAG: helix-turn-helix domain-containing protein [Clostridia bacterium]|nr:helix-turn-helix domain-containing protein [Clostridia bacterium]